MLYKKLYALYQSTVGTAKEKAVQMHEVIYGNSEYGRFAQCPVDWLEHKIETGEINSWK